MIKRVYYRYELWEDWKSGMYNKGKRSETIQKSIQLLIKPDRLLKAMNGVVADWKYSSEHNLTNLNRNRQAWLGQAACCRNHGATEDETKLAWGQTPDISRDLANGVADQIIVSWEINYSSLKNQLGFFDA